MRIPSLFAILVATGGALSGCGADKRLPAVSGTGGGTGGAVGNTGGTVGNTGGTVGDTGGSAGGSAGGGAGGAAASDGGVCVNPGAPPVLPWTLVMADAGSPAPSADGGGSGCQGSGSGYSWKGTCAGAAWLRPGGGAPTLSWDDGSQLVWNAVSWQQPLAPPGAAAAEARVWASLTRDVRTVCSVCGATASETIEIRESAGGPLLFLAKYGLDVPEPTVDQLTALFGVSAHARPICTLSDRDGCTAILRTVSDHVVDTTPPQTVPPAVLTSVTAPNGTIQVIWYASSEQQRGSIQGCADGIPTGPAMGFVGSRL